MPSPVPETPPVCLCSHGKIRHPPGWCILRACGCGVFRLDPKATAAAKRAQRQGRTAS